MLTQWTNKLTFPFSSSTEQLNCNSLSLHISTLRLTSPCLRTEPLRRPSISHLFGATFSVHLLSFSPFYWILAVICPAPLWLPVPAAPRRCGCLYPLRRTAVAACTRCAAVAACTCCAIVAACTRRAVVAACNRYAAPLWLPVLNAPL